MFQSMGVARRKEEKTMSNVLLVLMLVSTVMILSAESVEGLKKAASNLWRAVLE